MSRGKTGGSANRGSFSRNLAAVTPATHAQVVQNSAGATMIVGFLEPLATRMPITVAGISCTLLVLMARKVHMALVATPGRRLSRSRSAIARRPKGVAALPRPSMLAAMFMTIAPIAG